MSTTTAPDIFADLSEFIDQLGRIAGHLAWGLDTKGRLRVWLDGVCCCPLQVAGYARSGVDAKTRIVPTRDLPSAAGVSDRVGAAIVHHADDFTTSRYWRPEVRRRLLAACKVKERWEEEVTG